jgi:hypothetical protein
VDHFKERLTNTMPAEFPKVTSHKGPALALNDPFMQMWQRIVDLVYHLTQEYDQKWRKRHRLLDTL